MAEAPSLSPRLREVLDAIPDRPLADRLELVYFAAARAIEGLSDIDLVRYESTSIEGAPDLSMWEEMAPVIRDTVMDVNGLLSVVREQFPPPVRDGLVETISRAIEEAGPFPPGTLQMRRADEAQSAVRALSEQLSQQITQLGERMRSPQVVSDRWNLLTDLQTFRTRFRELIGDLVFLSASAFGELERVDVVPGYAEEITQAVTVRAAVADLSRVVQARLEQVKTATLEDVLWYAQTIEKELDAFGRTTAYRSLRAQDKRVIIEFRHVLGEIAARPAPTRDELVAALGPFADFTHSLQRVNQREILVAHDRAAWAACGVKLEQAQAAVSEYPEEAKRLLLESVQTAQTLYGRDGALDVFLRRARKGELAAVPPELVPAQIEKLRELLASLPVV